MSKIDLALAQALKPVHYNLIFKKRIRVLAERFSSCIPQGNLRGLDVGCGSGQLTSLLQEMRPDIVLDGAEVFVRPNDYSFKVIPFDGKTLPVADKSYDFVVLSDVLHHTSNPLALLKECARVTRSFILIKDHYCETSWDRIRLKLMDWAGNRQYDIPLPNNYLSRKEWQSLFQQASLGVRETKEKLGLYSVLLGWIFEGSLHFVSKLKVN